MCALTEAFCVGTAPLALCWPLNFLSLGGVAVPALCYGTQWSSCFQSTSMSLAHR